MLFRSGVGYHIHVAEGIYDLHQCLKEHGKRIVDRLYDWNIPVSYTHLKKDPNILGVSFSRNFGKEAALFAGLAQAKGDAVRCV